MRAGGHYITGEKLRGDSKEAQSALARQGRYRKVAGNLEIKEVVLDDGTMRDRFVICRNPEAAERDRNVRAQLLERLESAIAGNDDKPLDERLALLQSLRTRPSLARFLRVAGSGASVRLRVDRAAVAAAEKLDGKFLIRTSDPTLSAEEVAIGYKQLLQVERAWRDMKTTLDLRPVYHRRQERIRAHVLLCWLSLLLIRIAENGTGQTWHRLRWELEKMHLGRFSGRVGLVHQRTEVTTAQRAILTALSLHEPPRFFHLEAAVSDSAESA